MYLEGFRGTNKLFLLEFSMPHTLAPAPNGNDQPAIWLLNARIPYTAQYHRCNCWASGCGEFDVFEVLAAGGDKVKTAWRSGPGGGGGGGGGDMNYFERPAEGEVVRVAVVLDGERDEISVEVLGKGGKGEFPARMEVDLELGVGKGVVGGAAVVLGQGGRAEVGEASLFD